ncbi:MAG: sulfotransferase [Flavobacteriaceae bacterium]|nr:sulfotransferase [Flavobacteriaceae bacterium]
MEAKKVNLFLVGAMKAGTTFFSELLEQHPQIYASPIKEPHFFVKDLSSRFYQPSKFFELERYLTEDFPKPLHITKIETLQQYQKAYSLATHEKFLLDASTCYLQAPEAAKLIFEYNPEAKIVIIVRDPLKRAISDYQMNFSLGRLNASFTEIMEKEIKLYEEGTLSWESYLAMSFYDESIKRYKALFGKNVKVISFEKLVKNPMEETQAVFSFLGLEQIGVNAQFKKNETRHLRGQLLFYRLKQLGLKDYFSKIVGQKTRQFIFKMVSSNKKKEIALSSNLNEKIKIIFSQKSTYDPS